MIFEPLSEKIFQQVSDLAETLFPREAALKEGPILAYRASLWPEKNKDYFEKYHLKTLEYFIARDENNGEIIGVTGLYTRTIDPSNVVWLGWYGVFPQKRKQGFGEYILNWTMETAKKRGFTVMRLYTSNDPNEEVAQHLYNKLEFKITGTEEYPNNYKIIYRQRNL